MENLVFDDGIIRLNVNGNGILSFNPSDFNLYKRFFAFSGEVLEIEKEYAKAELEEEVKNETEFVQRSISKAAELDVKVKEKLNSVFGLDNDFNKIFGGVNLMSFGSNGERVLTNFLNAITPFIEKGVNKYADDEVAEAKANREQRRATQKKAKT